MRRAHAPLARAAVLAAGIACLFVAQAAADTPASSCVVSDWLTGTRFDLSQLQRSAGQSDWLASYGSSRVYINVCGQLVSTPQCAGSFACLVTPGGAVRSLGHIVDAEVLVRRRPTVCPSVRPRAGPCSQPHGIARRNSADFRPFRTRLETGAHRGPMQASTLSSRARRATRKSPSPLRTAAATRPSGRLRSPYRCLQSPRVISDWCVAFCSRASETLDGLTG
jgi:hypothetical protein